MLEIFQEVVKPEPWWQHGLEIFLTGTVPIILWMLNNRRRARNEAQTAAEGLKEELEKKHKENTERLDDQDKKLDDILHREKYLPSHGHSEKSGPLTVDGIIPRR